MKMKNKKGQAVIVFLIIIAIIAFAYFSVVGIHYNTGSGQHTGFVTATETTGIIFKTHTVYFKTNTMSSQEDAYCVIDNSVYNQLEQMQQNNTQVTISYISYLHAGLNVCNGEPAIITGVSNG